MLLAEASSKIRRRRERHREKERVKIDGRINIPVIIPT